LNWKKIIGKFLYTPSILLGVSTLVFFIFQIKPGDPSRMLGGQFTDEATLQAIRKDIGLDLTASQKYLRFLNEISPISFHTQGHFTEYKEIYGGLFLYEGNHSSLILKVPFFGKSYQSKRSVNSIIADALPGTAILALTSIVLALFLGIVFGILSAIYNGSAFDKALSFLSVIGMSGPSFFIGIIVAWVGAFLWHSAIFINVILLIAVLIYFVSRLPKLKKYNLHFVALGAFVLMFLLPSVGFNLPGTGLNVSGSLHEVDPFLGKQLALHNLILPALTLAIRPLAVFTPMIKNLLLEEMSKDYIRTYKSYGFGSWFLHFKQAFPNILNPVITSVSGWLASLLAGALFVEYIFSWRGLGLEMFEALERDDIPVVMGLVLLFAAIFVSVNALVNQSYKLIDPRLRK
jgi:peptide/nickel transport system permease protein